MLKSFRRFEIKRALKQFPLRNVRSPFEAGGNKRNTRPAVQTDMGPEAPNSRPDVQTDWPRDRSNVRTDLFSSGEVACSWVTVIRWVEDRFHSIAYHFILPS